MDLRTVLRSFESPLITGALAAALCEVSSAQCPFTLAGADAYERFGFDLDWIEDIDGDGVGDLAASAFPAGGTPGEVRFHSGASGVLLDRIAHPSLFFGNFLAGIGDVDSDGYGDLAVGLPPSTVFVYSGHRRTLLYFFTGAGGGISSLRSAAGIGDVSGDGLPDLAVGDIALNRVWVISGADGKVLFTLGPNPPTCTFGQSVGAAGDLDGDGTPDILVGSPTTQKSSGFSSSGGAVWAFSGADGSLIHLLTDPTNTARLGWSVSSIGDIDGDARPDFVAGGIQTLSGTCFDLPPFGADSTDPIYGPGLARVYSGASGQMLYEYAGSQTGDQFGISVGGGRDVDGDAVPDFAVGANQNVYGPTGYACVYSGATGSLLHTLHGHDYEFFGQSLEFLADSSGDGVGELAVGIPGRGLPAKLQVGAVEVFLGNCPAPEDYCSGKPSSIFNCPPPHLEWSGIPSLTDCSFVVRAKDIPNGPTLGVCIYSTHGEASLPFQGGILCVNPPVKRTLGIQSSGTPGDCDGILAFDFNTVIQSGIDPALVLGAVVYLQVWFRDTGDPQFSSGLSNAVSFTICS